MTQPRRARRPTASEKRIAHEFARKLLDAGVFVEKATPPGEWEFKHEGLTIEEAGVLACAAPSFFGTMFPPHMRATVRALVASGCVESLNGDGNRVRRTARGDQVLLALLHLKRGE